MAAMSAAFTVSIDVAKSIVRLKTAGFFMPADVERLSRQLGSDYRRLRCRANDHRTLLDIREMAIQSQDSFRAFASLVNDPGTRSRALAVVTAQSLARMQMKRAAASRPGATFLTDDVAAAEQWLVEH